MIVQIAGTSGSGKSHLMRSFLNLYEEHQTPQYGKGRESPLWYRLNSKKLARPVAVLGHYATPTGGCDTIKPLDTVFDLIYSLGEDHNVVYEGLFCMNHTRGAELASHFGEAMNVLQLMTPLEECIRSINSRRAERGAGALENKRNTEDNFRRCQRYCSTMYDAGATVIKVQRKEALARLVDLVQA